MLTQNSERQAKYRVNMVTWSFLSFAVRVVLTTATATATETSPENITLFHLCYFAIISTRSTYRETANYQGTKLVGVAFKLRKKMKHSPSCAHVLHKTLNVVISRCCFAEGGKEMYQNVKRTCRAIVFFSLNPLHCGVVVSVAVVDA